ncbi:helix-turn-helix domain-containing protein [Aeromicrobium ginsengisoli]|uniref:Helix-turn-helix transcriptional regulator n=1 Tax=Aeromicrobium ginsengisoli TaxID=363867 RepID=A0A5M4FCI7_9ACTN|nr:XRE family transcriptional regulator [Aeromicrobium ginsengisoli]KAA1395600.1 helix-turn-helix transcriptional regulator [Aeromicrobium ginsengisoli]
MTDDLATALTSVGPRLRALRQLGEATLAQLSATTGISVSTLSRLESGQRKPTLELLLPLAKAHGVTLDELVEAQPTDDPRIQADPIHRHGRTFVPLTRQAGGLQAYKVVIPPTTEPDDDLKTHEGYEWLYVLSGRLRLRIGEHDLVLGPGEAAEFDTRLPHGLSNPGKRPVELLTLFGTQGERMHVRAKPRSKE